MVILGLVETTTIHSCGLHNGEMVVLFLPSTDLGGCSRSGDKARRNKGEPGSADFGRLKEDFFAEFGVKLAPGL